MAASSETHASMQPAHPGEILGEIVIPATGKTKAEIAQLLKVSRQTLHAILARRQALSPVVAAGTGKLFGNRARFWFRLQTAYDTGHVEQFVDRSGIEALPIT